MAACIPSRFSTISATLFFVGAVLADTSEKERNENNPISLHSPVGVDHETTTSHTVELTSTNSAKMLSKSSTHPSTEHTVPANITTTAKSTTVTPASKFGNWSVYYDKTTNPCIRIYGIIHLNVTETIGNRTVSNLESILNLSGIIGSNSFCAILLTFLPRLPSSFFFFLQRHYDVDVPPHTKVTGNCEQKKPYIRFLIDDFSNSTLQFKFALNKTTHPETVLLHVVDGLIAFPDKEKGNILVILIFASAHTFSWMRTKEVRFTFARRRIKQKKTRKKDSI